MACGMREAESALRSRCMDEARCAARMSVVVGLGLERTPTSIDRHGALIVDGVALLFRFARPIVYQAITLKTQKERSTIPRLNVGRLRRARGHPVRNPTLLRPCADSTRSINTGKKTPGGARTHRYPAHTAARGAAGIRSLLTISRKVLYSSPFAFRSALTQKHKHISKLAKTDRRAALSLAAIRTLTI